MSKLAHVIHSIAFAGGGGGGGIAGGIASVNLASYQYISYDCYVQCVIKRLGES